MVRLAAIIIICASVGELPTKSAASVGAIARSPATAALEGQPEPNGGADSALGAERQLPLKPASPVPAAEVSPFLRDAPQPRAPASHSLCRAGGLERGQTPLFANPAICNILLSLPCRIEFGRQKT